SADLASAAVTNVKISDGAVTAAKIAPGANGQVLTTANGAVTWAAPPSSSAGWGLAGNSGTTTPANFLGTTDGQSLQFRVNNQQALLLQPASGSPNLIGGASINGVGANVKGATIGGGGWINGLSDLQPNSVLADFGTIGGGHGNQTVSTEGTIGGG